MRVALVLVIAALVATAALAVVLTRVNTSPGGGAAPSPTSSVEQAAVGSLPASASLPSATEPVPAPQASAKPVVYVVQSGDTLSAIAVEFGVTVEEIVAANDLADPDVLTLGQELKIPLSDSSAQTEGSEPAATAETALATEPMPTPEGPTPTPPPTPTPGGPPLVEVGQVLGSGTLAAEVVVIRNRGGACSLEGWTLSNGEGDVYTFPAVVLYTNAEVRLHTVSGADTPADLHWGRAEASWLAGGLITLRDARGAVVDTYIVP